jgi:hypothetical protein
VDPWVKRFDFVLGYVAQWTLKFLSTLPFLSLSLFFLSLWRLELRVYTLSTSPALFVLGIFKIGSHKLFAQAGFKPQSS